MTPLEQMLGEALEKARDEFLGLPHSLGYEFTHLPEINAALAEYRRQQDLEKNHKPY